jgi:hypothetical protein
MDDQIAKQLIRQLKLLNFWITFFGTIFLVGMILMGFLLVKVGTFVKDSGDKLTKIQTQTTETLDVKSDLCKNDALKNTSYCQD